LCCVCGSRPCVGFRRWSRICRRISPLFAERSGVDFCSRCCAVPRWLRQSWGGRSLVRGCRGPFCGSPRGSCAGVFHAWAALAGIVLSMVADRDMKARQWQRL
jgi:hypothetical protein